MNISGDNKSLSIAIVIMIVLMTVLLYLHAKDRSNEIQKITQESMLKKRKRLCEVVNTMVLSVYFSVLLFALGVTMPLSVKILALIGGIEIILAVQHILYCYKEKLDE